MGNYAVPGLQTISTTYKTAALIQGATTGALRRAKVWDILIGQSANPNATDTYVQWDVSRLTASGAGAYTAWTPTTLDPADSACVTVAGVNNTAEATTITANSSLWNLAINQRGSFRWQAPQESQTIILAATASAGVILRGLSSTFTGTVTGQMTFQE